MKAIVCTKYGAPEVLQIKEVDKPVPRDNEVLVKIAVTAVTVGDCRIRGFKVPLSFWLPARLALGLRKPKKEILGSVFAGEIEYVGKNVRLFKKGDQVFAGTGHNFGAYTEYICMPENGYIAIKPTNLTFEEAAAIPWGGYTSLHFLRKAEIKPEQKILIYGASGSLGTSAVQLAKYFGAVVTGVCSTSNLNLVKSLGADRVIDYTKEDFSKSSETYDIVYDTVGKCTVSACIRSLKKNGKYIHAVATPAVSAKIKWLSMGRSIKFIGGSFTPSAENLNYLKKIIEEEKLMPVIDRIYNFDQIVEAHRYVDTGHKKGNVVIKVN
jgi:NADPH:quinone reductase-like Zn-dependent oxidoreductase